MKTPRDALSLFSLVLANLTPLVGVFVLGWNARVILLLYWGENLVIGGFNILKMALVPVPQPSRHLAKLFVIPFFCLRFGGFCAVYGFFLLAFFNLAGGGDSGLLDLSWPGHLVFVRLLVNVVKQIWHAFPVDAYWALMLLVASHAVSFCQNFLYHREYEDATLQSQMGRPYRRIVILHVTIIAGAVPIMLLGSPTPLILILVAVKTAIDIRLHNKSHRTESPVLA